MKLRDVRAAVIGELGYKFECSWNIIVLSAGGQSEIPMAQPTS